MFDERDPEHAAWAWACRLATTHLLAASGAGHTPGMQAADADMRHYWEAMGEAERAAARDLSAAMARFSRKVRRGEEECEGGFGDGG